MKGKDGQVVYRYGKGSLQEERMNYLEFIARVTSHIPDKGQIMLRYYALYANTHRGKMRKSYEEMKKHKIFEEENQKITRKGWVR